MLVQTTSRSIPSGVRQDTKRSRRFGNLSRCAASKGSQPEGQSSRPLLPRSSILHRPVLNKPSNSTRGSSPFLDEKFSQLLQIDNSSAEGMTIDRAHDALGMMIDILQCHESFNHEEIVSTCLILGRLVIWGPFQKRDLPLRDTFNLLTVVMTARIQDLSISEVCAVIWVYGSLGKAAMNTAFFKGVRSLIIKLCMRAESEGVDSISDASHLFCGIQKMGFPERTMVTQNTLNRLGPVLKTMDLNFGDLAKLILVAGKLRVENGIMFLRYTSRVVKNRFDEFTDKSMCDFIRGFSEYDILIMPELFDHFTAELERRMSTINIYYLIHATYHLSKICYLPSDGFLKKLNERVISGVDSFRGRDVATCIQFAVRFNYSDDVFLDTLIYRFTKNRREFTTSEACFILLSCARIHKLTEKTLSLGLERIGYELPVGLQKSLKLTIHEVLTHAEIFLGIKEIPESIFRKKWIEMCREEWTEVNRRPVRYEIGEIWNSVNMLDLEIRHESTPVGQLNISYIVSPDGERRIVLDLISSKIHCFLNHPETLLPWKQWEYRVIEKQGFEIVSIFDHVWRQVPEEKKLRFLAKQLNLWTFEEIEKIEAKCGITQRQVLAHYETDAVLEERETED